MCDLNILLLMELHASLRPWFQIKPAMLVVEDDDKPLEEVFLTEDAVRDLQTGSKDHVTGKALLLYVQLDPVTEPLLCYTSYPGEGHSRASANVQAQRFTDLRMKDRVVGAGVNQGFVRDPLLADAHVNGNDRTRDGGGKTPGAGLDNESLVRKPHTM